MSLKITILKLLPYLPGAQEFNKALFLSLYIDIQPHNQDVCLINC